MKKENMLLRNTLFLLLLLGCNFIQLAPTLTPKPLPPTITNTPTNTPALTITPLPPTATPYPPTIMQKSAEMVLVPAVEFIMGSDIDEVLAECQKYSDHCSRNYFKDEYPPHQIYLDAYYVDIYEVTNSLFAECVAASVCNPPSSTNNKYYSNPVYADYPVIYVDWFDANTYCEWRGGRLPTEAEWEKAARAETPLLFPWGDDFDGDLVNFCDKNCELDWANKNYDDGYPGLSPVGSYPGGISPYGLYDMAGNAFEWVVDWYDDEYYSISPSSNPLGPNSGQYRVLRGGTWSDFNFSVRTADRYWSDPSTSNDLISFRCASSPATSTTNKQPTGEPSIIIRLSKSSMSDPIQLEVIKGKYKLSSGAELWEGSNISVQEDWLTFPAGLAIQVGEGGVSLKGKKYPDGAMLIVDEQGNLVETTSEAYPGSPLPQLDILGCNPVSECPDSAVSIWSFFDENEILQYNTEYTVSVSLDTEVHFSIGWCTLEQEMLDDNLQHIEFVFSVGGVSMIDQFKTNTYTVQDETDSTKLNYCHSVGGVVSGWQKDQSYRIVFGMKIKDTIFDGWDTYQPVDYTRIYLISADP